MSSVSPFDTAPPEVTALDRFLDTLSDKGIGAGTLAYANRLQGWEACEEAMRAEVDAKQAELLRWKQRFADLYAAVLKLHDDFDSIYDVDVDNLGHGVGNVDSDIAFGIVKAYEVARRPQ